MALWDIESERTRLRQLSKLKDVKDTLPSGQFCPDGEGRARDVAASKIGMKPRLFKMAKTIIERAPEPIKQQLREGKLTISGAYRDLKQKEAEQKAKLQYKTSGTANESNYRLICGDVEDESNEIESGSVDVIITDPPYGREAGAAEGLHEGRGGHTDDGLERSL